MTIRKVRPGLYERTDTPKQVTITREFADAVRKYSGSLVLGEILEDAIREQEERPKSEAKPNWWWY
jgi:hypothetical protein